MRIKSKSKDNARLDGKSFRADYLGYISIEKERVDGRLNAELTPEGYLRAKGRIARTGCQLYFDGSGEQWIEYRSEEEVFDEISMKSFEMVPITDDHPSEMVDISNRKELEKGVLGSVIYRDGIYLVADLLITDKDLIQSILDGEKVELSCGYWATIINEDGVAPDGTAFQKKQTDIEGNHVAVVTEGRAGPACKIYLDNKCAISAGEKQIVKKRKDEKLMLGEMEFEVPEEVAVKFKELMAKVEEQGAELSKLAAQGDAEEVMPEVEIEVKQEEPKVEEEVLSMDAMKARIDMLEAQLKANKFDSARIDARVNLVSTARSILGSDFKSDGISDSSLMKSIVLSLVPSMKGKMDGKSEDYIKATYDMALEGHRKSEDSNKELFGLVANADRADERDSTGTKLDALRNKFYGRGEKK